MAGTDNVEVERLSKSRDSELAHDLPQHSGAAAISRIACPFSDAAGVRLLCINSSKDLG